MEKSIQKVWSIRRIILFFVIAIIGASLHFAWQNIRHIPIAQIFAPLVPLNESYWEHAKLAVTPLLVYFIIQYFLSFKGKKLKGLWVVCAAAGLWSAVISMFVIHASLIAVFGDGIELVVSILTFFINVFISMSIFHNMQKRQHLARYSGWYWASLIVLLASLIIYSYWPLPIELFKSTDYNYFGQNYPF